MCRRARPRPLRQGTVVLNRIEHALVLDTNVALDLLLFGDPASLALQGALARGALNWCATPAMREELARVLGYPQIEVRLRQRGCLAETVLQAFDRMVCTLAAAPKACYTCKDPDDQKFIDLAAEHRAVLLSKDAQVLCMGRRLARLGVRVARSWDDLHEQGGFITAAT
jgi:putative PIN family toxin of toxin-antitoxin system